MKTKSIILIIFLLITTTGYSQLNYEGTIDSRYKTVQLENGEFKYLKYDKNLQEIRIYSMDNSLWKTVKLPLPDQHILDEVKLVSLNTFNKDDLVEIAYSCVVYTHNPDYEDPSKPFVFIDFTLNIINEKGEHLLKVDGSNEMEIINSDGQKKLLIFKHIGKGFQAHDQTIIYSIQSN